VLSVEHLTVDLRGADQQPGLVEDVSFEVYPDRTLALIGESGCGKTMTAMSILGLLPVGMHVSSGRIAFGDQDLLTLRTRELREIRGSGIGMIFQDPMSSLNPTTRVGDQIVEARRLHIDEPKSVSVKRAVELLDQVGIPNAAKRVDAYPFEMSGGMQQRVMIAMAIACDPQLLIADEPTTALDVTIQAEILDVLASLQRDRGMGILLVTHDLGVVADFADDVAVMYAGHVVEYGLARDVFHDARHPYARGLLDSMPQGATPRSQLSVVPGRVPMAGQFPIGCRFQDRCPHIDADVCLDPTMSLVEVAPLHKTRCVRVQRHEIELTPRSVERRADG
jgi:oligopeptide/dipeptide ABC transporter ATP-binding protein